MVGTGFFPRLRRDRPRAYPKRPGKPALFLEGAARQVHVTGTADKVPAAESMRYFASRPRGSQLGAWVSQQSSIISSRQLLLTKFEELKAKFRRGEVPLPGFRGGYRIQPDTFEFWQGRENRLHDRFFYTHHSVEWTIQRLAP